VEQSPRHSDLATLFLGAVAAEALVMEERSQQRRLLDDLTVWALVGLALVLLGIPAYSLLLGTL
jgi:hypothetical protein